MSRAMRPPVRTHLDIDDQERLDREASARGISVSQCIRDCLREYFALRAEVATALDPPEPGRQGEASTGLIHTLFARTEGRLVATLETCAEAVDRVRAEVRLVQTMLDRLTFLYLVHTPEVPAAQRDTALGSGTRRHASWRQAAVRMADDGWLDRVLTRSNGTKRGA